MGTDYFGKINVRGKRRKLREMTTTYCRSMLESKKCWKQIVKLVPCSKVNSLNHQSMKKTLPSPGSVRDCRKELWVELPRAEWYSGSMLIWGPTASGLVPETWGMPGACRPAACVPCVHSLVPPRVRGNFKSLTPCWKLGVSSSLQTTGKPSFCTCYIWK